MANDVRVDPDWAGTPDQKTLRFVASFAYQRRELIIGFDTFGERRQPQPMRKANDGTNDCQRSVRLAQACDERSVDLDSVERPVCAKYAKLTPVWVPRINRSSRKGQS
jgi:hypothetical protein